MSQLEQALLMHIRGAGLPDPVREFCFCRGIGWRFDLAYPLQMIAIECEGGTWVPGGGRHQRGQGYEDDARKYAYAALLEWKVLRVTGGMIDSGEALLLIEVALGVRSVDSLIERRAVETTERRKAGAAAGWKIRKAKEEGSKR